MFNFTYLNPATCLFYDINNNFACEERSSLAKVIEQWNGNPKDAGSNLVGRQFFRIASFT